MTKHSGISSGLVLLALAGTTALACSELNAPLYFEGPTFWAPGSGDDEPMATSGRALRFRNPTMQEQTKLAAQRDALGYDVPWISRDKVHVQVSYKVTYRCPTAEETAAPDGPAFECNPGDLPGEASFTVITDGANEFTKYDTQAVADGLGGDDPIFLPLIPSIPKTLAYGTSYSGIVREDDFAEGELDLDALGRWNDADPASPTFAGVLINRSDVNPIGLNLVPPNLVVPAIYEVHVRLRSNAPMLVEYYIRVRDDDDRLLHDDADTLYQPSPTLFQPPALM
jgi:hypothetical protein